MKTKQHFGMKQQMLYTICNQAWLLCLQFLADFAALKAFYTPQFIEDQQLAVSKAEALPNILQTINNRTIARIDLTLGTRLVMTNWQSLKAYIETAFIPEKVDAMLEAAGASLYIKASRSNWDGTRSLIDAANNFIAANAATLTDNGNMPATFPATFQADSEACIALATTFAEADVAKEMATNNKAEANINIYQAVARMMKDGQHIFKDTPAVKKQFTISYLVSVNGGEGSASLRGYIVNELNLPVQGVSITAMGEKYRATTNEKGHYRINRIAEGSYAFNITCPGYTPLEQVITFSAGTASKANFALVNVMKKVA